MSVATKKTFALILVALVILAAVQVEQVDAGKSDLIFVKGKFIKKDKKGVIVVEEKCCGCHGHR